MNDALGTLGGVALITPPALDLTTPAGLWLMSDLHVGASNVDYGRIKTDVKRAAARRDRVLINGDLLDAIVSGDPRYQSTVLHKRLQDEGDGDDFPIDAAVEWLAELLEPAAVLGLIDYVGHGNHETALQKRSGMSVYTALKRAFGIYGDGLPQPAGYCGFVNYRLTAGPQRLGNYVVFAHHGSKSGTGRGQLDKLAGIADADLTWIGHFHNKMSGGQYTVGPSPCGRRIAVRERRRVMTGGYSFAYGRNKAGKVHDRYASVTALAPGLIGGARVVLTREGNGVRAEVRS